MESLTEAGSPCEALGHLVQHRWELRECLHAWIPRLLIHSLSQASCRQILVLLEPVVGKSDLIRKCCRRTDLGYQRIGIKCDWRYQLLQLLRRQRSTLSRIPRRTRLLSLSLQWRAATDQHEA